MDLQFHYLESKLNTRISLDFYLSQILSVAPSTVQINQIIFNKNKIQIQATTGNYSDIGYYIKELENHELFKKPEYSFKPEDKTAGNYIVRNLNCLLFMFGLKTCMGKFYEIETPNRIYFHMKGTLKIHQETKSALD